MFIKSQKIQKFFLSLVILNSVNYFLLGLYYLHKHLTAKFKVFHITFDEWSFERFFISFMLVVFFILKYRTQTKTKWLRLSNLFGLLLILFLLRITQFFIDIFDFMQDDQYKVKEGISLFTYFMEYFGVLFIYILLAYQIVATILSFIRGKPKLDNYRLNSDN
jgi:hypothetical protein